VTLVASVVAASAAILVLASCTSGVGTAGHNTSSYSIGHVQTLIVDAQVGDVQVTGFSLATVSVTEHVTGDTTAPVTTRRIAAGTLTRRMSMRSQTRAIRQCRASPGRWPRDTLGRSSREPLAGAYSSRPWPRAGVGRDGQPG
jgi:hypothetical protein